MNGSPYLSQVTIYSYSQQKKKACRLVDLALPPDHQVKLKEGKKRDKYLKMLVIPTIVGALGTIPKRLVKGLEDLETIRQVETIQDY